MKMTKRAKNSVYNSFSSFTCTISIAILSFFVRSIFIKILGEQCLGLEGLFTNIISLLSLTELGFSTALSFSLYKPLADKDNKKISILITYIKKIYRYVALFILIIGLCIVPFLNLLIKEYTIGYNIYLIYLIYLTNTVLSFFLNYNSILLEADQKNYKLTPIKLIYNFVMYSLQIVFLYLYKNFIIYLLIQFVCGQIHLLVQYIYIKYKYKFINVNSKDKLPITDKKEIKQNVIGIIYHKIGNFLVNGTDNILISSIINISTTGIYANYLSITSIFKTMISGVISATTSTFGNIGVLENSDVKKNSFDIINFIGYTISGYVCICLYFCLNPFISIWIGEKYCLDMICVGVICINLYLNIILTPVETVKAASGMYYIDRFIPIIQAIINLIVSIVLGIKIGILGILLGTLLSSILTVNIVKPYLIYKRIFMCSYLEYLKVIMKNILMIIIVFVISYSLCLNINLSNILSQFLFNGCIITIIYIILIIVLYRNSKEFKYILEIIKAWRR